MRDPKTGRFCKAHKFKVGDLVIITKGDHPFTHKGDIAKLVRQDEYGDWLADFNEMGNKYVNGDGEWCLYLSRFVPYAPSTKFSVGEVVAINGQRGKWSVEVCESARYLCQSNDNRLRQIWAKPEDMQKAECVEQVPTKPDSSPQIIPGSVVRLRSGGPDMTVGHAFDRIRGGKTFACDWFTPCGERRSGAFDPESLELVR